MKSELIAHCGMNCNICVGFLRDKNKCQGCKSKDKKNSKYCSKCIIKNCEIIKKNKWKFCSAKCEKFPCRRLKDLDKRYKTKYNMSMIDNLNVIENKGIREFLKQQKKKYIKGGKVLCIHNKNLYDVK
jgi:hypothetical protein